MMAQDWLFSSLWTQARGVSIRLAFVFSDAAVPTRFLGVSLFWSAIRDRSSTYEEGPKC